MPIFEIKNNSVKSVKAKDFKSEKELQKLVENNLETIFKCRFIETEFITGDEHGGRIDTLALSEENHPVIIEYKIKEASDLINQSLFYLHWLNDHKGDFITAVNNKFGHNKEKVDWSFIRVICIAPRFRKYDLLAVKTMGVNIELWQYKLYENNNFYLEEVFRKELTPLSKKSKEKIKNNEINLSYEFEDHLANANEIIKPLLLNIREYLLNLDDSVNENPKKQYIAYSSTQNFACLVVLSSAIWIYLKINPDIINPFPKNGKNVKDKGHWGTGDFGLKISSEEQLEEAKDFIKTSFNIVGG